MVLYARAVVLNPWVATQSWVAKPFDWVTKYLWTFYFPKIPDPSICVLIIFLKSLSNILLYVKRFYLEYIIHLNLSKTLIELENLLNICSSISNLTVYIWEVEGRGGVKEIGADISQLTRTLSQFSLIF